MPTSATSATPTWAGTTFCDIGANTGIPTISVPAGFTSTGAPVGLELAAPRSRDGDLLAMAYAYEQATGHRVAPETTPELAADVDPAPAAAEVPADDDPASSDPAPAPEALGAVRTAGIGVNTLAENLAIAAGLALFGGIVVAAGLVRRRRHPAT